MKLTRRHWMLISTGLPLVGGSWFYLSNNDVKSASALVPLPPPIEEYIELGEIYNESIAESYADAGDGQQTPLNHSWITKLQMMFNFANDAKHTQLAQSIDYPRSVSLARIPNIDSNLFRFPLRTHKLMLRLDDRVSHFELDELMSHLLRSVIRVQGQSECARYFTEQALVLFESDVALNDIFSHLEYRTHEKKYLKRYQKLFFQAILQNLVSGEEQAVSLLNNGLLVLFHKLRESDIESREVAHWISTCLAALTAYPSTHLHLYHTGWIRVLVQWLNSTDLRLKLESAKVLHNMAHPDRCLQPSIYLLHPIHEEHSEQVPEVDIIFVHGLKGGVFKTWRQADSMKHSDEYTECWPGSWLAPDLAHCRVLAVNYDSFLSNWNINCASDTFSLRDRSRQLIHELHAAQVGQRPIIWVTHSMGGLLVKHMLAHLDQDQIGSDPRSSLLDQTRGIVFYSVPHRGSEMAVWSQNIERIISPSNHVLELRKDCPTLLSLHDQFLELTRRKRIQCLSFCETKKCTLLRNPIEWKVLLVPEESANPGIGQFIILPEDHFNICKPKNKEAESYVRVKEFISSLMAKPTTKFDMDSFLFFPQFT